MSEETPLPQPLPLQPPGATGPEHTGVVRRSPSRPPVAMSAFSPGTANVSDLRDEDTVFFEALASAGLGAQLKDDELERVVRTARSAAPAGRRLDLLGAYYAGESIDVGSERCAHDRWFLHDAEDAATAASTVARLLRVWPELVEAQLERIGGEEGMLVVRSGEHFCAIEDEAPEEGGICSVSVREIVRSFNVLLDRKGHRRRLVGLRGDGRREAYVGLASIADAMALCQKGYLAEDDPEIIMHLAAW